MPTNITSIALRLEGTPCETLWWLYKAALISFFSCLHMYWVVAKKQYENLPLFHQCNWKRLISLVIVKITYGGPLLQIVLEKTESTSVEVLCDQLCQDLETNEKFRYVLSYWPTKPVSRLPKVNQNPVLTPKFTPQTINKECKQPRRHH